MTMVGVLVKSAISKITILGVGLIGGSLAIVYKKGSGQTDHRLRPPAENLKKAVKLGVIDGTTRPS
jgi:prephenate dehydrogenase